MSKRLTDVLSKKLDFVGDTPIDGLFLEIDEFLNGIKVDDGSTSILEDLSCNQSELISRLVLYLERLVDAVAKKQDENADIIPISLHDMKHFDTLINVLVIHGINANLPVKIDIPLEYRQLSSFKDGNKLYKSLDGKEANLDDLKKVLKAFEGIFLRLPKQNYVRQILLKGGPGFIDTVIGNMSLMYVTRDTAYEDKLRALETVRDTYSLFEMYSLLLSTIKQNEFKEWPLSRLGLLVTERSDGLMSLIDFLVGVREDEQVDTSKFERVNMIVTAKPKSLSSVEYFSKVFDQIYEGLTHVDKPILTSCLNGLIGTFYMKNKRIIRDFLFKKIYHALYNPNNVSISIKTLNDMINVLISLGRTTMTEVLQDLVSDNKDGGAFYLYLWKYALFLKTHQKLSATTKDQPYYHVILGIIKTYMTVTEGFRFLHVILLDLISYDHEEWEYKIELENQLPYVSRKSENVSEKLGMGKLRLEDETTKKFQTLLSSIDPAVMLYIELLGKIDDQQVNKLVFSTVLNNWLMQSTQRDSNSSKSLMLPEEKENDTFIDSLQSMVFLKVLETMNEAFKSSLLTEPYDLLIIILQLLDHANYSNEIKTQDSDDEDEDEPTDASTDDNANSQNALSIALKLLTSALPTFTEGCKSKERALLISIQQKLLCYSHHEQISDILQQISASTSLPTLTEVADDSAAKDKALLIKALSNVNDPMVPVRAHGLFQLRSLIERRSSAIDVKRVFSIHMTQLHDQDPFIYLNVIRGLLVLLQLNPIEIMPLLLKFYQATGSKKSIDDILKVGEVLNSYVLTQGELFSGSIANQLVEICLQNIRNKDVVDNRIRMSSMSLLGQCIETNSSALQSSIEDILDCVFGILTFEAGHTSGGESADKNSAIMRRSAVHVLYDMIKNVGLALFGGNHNIESIKRTLSYVLSQDNDFLVCEQIKVVLEQVDIEFNNSLLESTS